jgi:transcription-repair coupling factor (superfamily II helicase)
MLGPALYGYLLERAKSELAGEQRVEEDYPHLHAELSRLLPKQYIQNEAARLEMYARISKCQSQGELDALEDELEERFGELPADAQNLLAAARIEIDCRPLGIKEINAGPAAVAATLSPRSRTRMGKQHGPVSWKDGRVVYRRPSQASDRLLAVRELLDMLQKHKPARTADGE